MNGFAYTLFMFLLALTILITIHEYGHYLVARCCGVKVLRFSLGFGKVIWSRRSKSGTEWAISLLPLGGYVKMLDEDEADVDDNEKHLAFNRQPLWQRVCVVIAGPLANFLLAFVVFWGIYTIGFDVPKAYLGEPVANSLSARAGLKENDLVLAVNGQPVRSWAGVHGQIVAAYGDAQPITFLLKTAKGVKTTKTITDTAWAAQIKPPHFLAGLGLTIYRPPVRAIVYKLVPDMPASKSGLKVGDLIVAVDGKAIKNWNQLTSYIKVRPLQRIQLTVQRKTPTAAVQRLPIVMTLSARKIGKQTFGFAGIRVMPVAYPADKLMRERYSFWQAPMPAAKKVGELTGLTFNMLGKLVTGRVSVRTVSGPVGIAVGAGESARSGIKAYLIFLALISISLGVINILPIPMLDGGHLLFYVIEVIRRKPLSRRAQTMAFKIGILIIIMVMVIALYSDFINLFLK